MVNQEFVKSIVSEVRKGLFEGGAGSGNWGHKGRPGHRGGSLGGGKGGKTTGKGWGELPKARAMTSNEKKFWEKFRKERVGGSGISAHMVKPGVHASTFYDKSGGLKTSEYKKLTDNQKAAVLKHGIQKYKENYVPKAKQGGMSEKALAANKKIGALEGMRRAAVNKAKGSTGKESRAAMHVAISLQERARATFSEIKASGSKAVGSAKGAGSKVIGAGLTAVRAAARPAGR